MRSIRDVLGPRRVLAAVAAVLLLAVVAVGLVPTILVESRNPEPRPTEWGPLGAADVELLRAARRAGLWEGPAGEIAREVSRNAKIQALGMTLMVDHGQLDVAVRQSAAKLRVPLPDEPNESQQGWLAEMRAAGSPEEFDQIFANRLRQAHGSVLVTIAEVRGGSRNAEVRDLASIANQAVLRHQNLLEKTGLVDFTTIAEPLAGTSFDTELRADARAFALVGLLVFAESALVVLLIAWLRRSRGKAAPPSVGSFAVNEMEGTRT
ncbi:DUF4142 domain-containing protein [Actinokineospora xionganensis]|uniref:DUF4142 domain-containing protein n=1 Tax=Actinokineospora xionganensis TaxID=2684470 RepID=A0ABR7LA86_9PSEU|nr:DUF4142 domain-containing protein [Actinokineospora xionganensis]MBC6449544.1 DUF4142 domain-containing protein [Actinokineospora xionganensis]